MKEKYTPEIAEILGAFIGDGWIESRETAFYIAGSPSEDKLYSDKHLSKLFSNNFITVKPKYFPYWKVYGITCYKRKVIQRLLDLGFTKGDKSLKVEIPLKVIKMNNPEIKKAILRGIFDADGSFWCEKSYSPSSTEWKRTHNYKPEFKITSGSQALLKQIYLILKEFKIDSKIVKKCERGFKCNRNRNESYALLIRKKNQIIKWFEIIGSNNPRHQTRYQVWQKQGYLPPKTTISDRMEILKSIDNI